jgi:hypothetical protein
MMGNELEKMKVTVLPKWRCYTGIFLEEWRKATKNKVFLCFVVSVRPRKPHADSLSEQSIQNDDHYRTYRHRLSPSFPIRHLPDLLSHNPCSNSVAATSYMSLTSLKHIYTLKNLFVPFFFISQCVPPTPSPRYTTLLLLLAHHPEDRICKLLQNISIHTSIYVALYCTIQESSSLPL